jgi:potassium efflux system protein
MIWGVYYNLKDALAGVLSFGFNVGEYRISVDLLLISAGILYGSVFLSWILRKVLMDDLLLQIRVERGVRLAMARLLHYFIVFIAFLLAISALGFDITKLTIILSALGVGIGFGLQSIVNNFVSGLILLFERPVRVGDSIELAGQWAEIKRIGLRATTVQTFDQADVIIPNADLVTNQVTNWTLSSRQVRLIVSVGVAYGSDVPLVTERLKACAELNPMIAQTPPPEVLFLSFGESSLDFELRVWVEADTRLKAKSELHQEIDRSFREANIEIAFPQRDLHIRSVDKSISLDADRKPAQ